MFLYKKNTSLSIKIASVMLVSLISISCSRMIETAYPQTKSDTNAQRLTALADNRAVNDFEFKQFKNVNLQLEMQDYSAGMSGNYYVLKISNDADTYFIGVVDYDSVLSLPLTIPAHLKNLKLEMYTDTSNENTYTEVLPV